MLTCLFSVKGMRDRRRSRSRDRRRRSFFLSFPTLRCFLRKDFQHWLPRQKSRSTPLSSWSFTLSQRLVVYMEMCSQSLWWIWFGDQNRGKKRAFATMGNRSRSVSLWERILQRSCSQKCGGVWDCLCLHLLTLSLLYHFGSRLFLNRVSSWQR